MSEISMLKIYMGKISNFQFVTQYNSYPLVYFIIIHINR